MNVFELFERALIIAEIGVNHNGNVELAKKMIDAAKESGADAVKFQTYRTKVLAAPDTPKVKYQLNSTSKSESHYEMLERLELSYDDHYELSRYCKKQNIDFLSTPYDIASARFLKELNVRLFKTASADLVDLPLQRYIASTGIPTMVSTGMASFEEIEDTVKIYNTYRNKSIILLHCVSSYPCSDASLNLRAMQSIGQAFSVPYGLSDHSLGFIASVAAVVMGAKVIEKHFTLDKELAGPDHKASANPSEFMDLVREVRRVETMLGSTHKVCQPEEEQMAQISRKSLVLSKKIQSGQIITEDHLELKRPGIGIGSSMLKDIVGKSVVLDLPEGHMIKWSDIKN